MLVQEVHPEDGYLLSFTEEDVQALRKAFNQWYPDQDVFHAQVPIRWMSAVRKIFSEDPIERLNKGRAVWYPESMYVFFKMLSEYPTFIEGE